MDFNLLRDREKGKDIYVIASGKSMGFIPDSFFDVCVSGALGVTPQFIALLALILYLKGERRDRLAFEG